jgi:hypothetical protein
MNGAYVRAATVGDLMTAQVLAARLEAEGIPARLHGEALGPYRLTVGHLAATEVWVPDTDLDHAAEVLLAAEIDGVLGESDADPEGGGSLRVPAAAVALLILAFLAWRITAWIG